MAVLASSLVLLAGSPASGGPLGDPAVATGSLLPDPILLLEPDVATELRAPGSVRRGRVGRRLRVTLRNMGTGTAHVADVEVQALWANGISAGAVEALGELPGPMAPGDRVDLRFRWRPPADKSLRDEPVLFFACASIAETDADPENDCDAVLRGPRRHAETLVLADEFDQQSPSWEWWSAGTGGHAISGSAAAFIVTSDSHAGEYSDAEINDYHRGPDRGFPWQSGLRLEIRARTSDDNGILSGNGRGTRGFGFWNLGTGGLGSATGMTNAWFISISPESFGGLLGIFAATVFDRGKPVLLQLLATDPRRWHTYGILWTARGVTFSVDQRPVASSPIAPQEKLGLVAWIDNYRLTITPNGIERDFLDLEHDQALFVDRLRVWTLDRLR